MSHQSIPASDALRHSLAQSLALESPIAIRRIDDISIGLSVSRVFRVIVEGAPGADDRSLILKIPEWGASSLVDPHDPMVSQRERIFFESDLPGRLPSGILVPSVLGIDQRDDQTWIWMEDVSSWLDVAWQPQRARRAAEMAARLHELYRREESSLAALSWLGRDEFATYAHHIPTARLNLDAVAHHPAWSRLFTADEIERLHEALDLNDWAIQEAKMLPQTLVHGDFHIRNLGFNSARELVVIDWAHLGIAPLGGDIATFVSVYRLFGGDDSGCDRAFEDELVAVYSREIERWSHGQQSLAEVTRGVALWHLTWGLHLRLGPGLTALLRGYILDTEERKRAASDVRAGGLRAIAAMDEVSATVLPRRSHS